jgi:hypothetical protein
MGQLALAVLAAGRLGRGQEFDAFELVHSRQNLPPVRAPQAPSGY